MKKRIYLYSDCLPVTYDLSKVTTASLYRPNLTEIIALPSQRWLSEEGGGEDMRWTEDWTRYVTYNSTHIAEDMIVSSNKWGTTSAYLGNRLSAIAYVHEEILREK